MRIRLLTLLAGMHQ